MKIRKLIEENDITTQDVQEYRALHGCGVQEAKNKCLNRVVKLQYEYERGKWLDVPTVVVKRKAEALEK